MIQLRSAIPASTTLACLLVSASASAYSPLPPGSAPAPAPAAPAAGPAADFTADVRLLYRVVACAGDGPLPANLDPAVVAEHCRALAPKMKSYQQKYVGDARAFIARLRPAGLPTTVVYPFGGGDLISALTTYPDATDVTTLSLEHAGDPRRLATIDKTRLDASLSELRRQLWGLLMADNSTTENLQKGQRSEIPGQLAFFVVALAVQGYEPVSLRYFTFQPDGSLHYLTAAEIATQEKTLARSLNGKWAPPTMSAAFSNMEMTFRPVGAGPDAPVRVHRHVAANLGNQGLAASPGLLRFLEAKGRIAAMTKAASYLLWREQFSTIRDYLLHHMEFMVSDSTGIPPHDLKQAGFSATTFGEFTGSFLPANEGLNKEFRELWSTQPQRKLPFRYGYLDAGRNYHLMVAGKAKVAQP